MEIKNKDMPAMPSQPIDTKESEWETGGGRYITSNGLTKREYFAAMAMQGIMANPNCEPVTPEHFKNIASDAINISDALLEELEK